MKKTIVLFAATLLCVAISFSENHHVNDNGFMIGSKTYSCTETFDFPVNDFMEHKLSFLIAKDSTKGMIALSFETHSNTIRIAKTSYIYLEDNTIITLMDRNIHDYVNGVSTTVYYLTATEIAKMKTTNISNIRFSTYNFMFKNPSPDENYKAFNEKNVYFEGKTLKGFNNIPESLKSLFNN